MNETPKEQPRKTQGVRGKVEGLFLFMLRDLKRRS